MLHKTTRTKFKYSLISFFQDPRVFVVGRDMAAVSRRLKSHNQIEMRNTVDLNELAVKGTTFIPLTASSLRSTVFLISI
ncbi:hypothetical protein COP2_007844 [Malus domestica]